MGALRRRLQAATVVVGLAILALAGAALYLGPDEVVVVAVLAVLALLLGMVAHMHQRVGDTLRAVLREQKQEERERHRAREEGERSERHRQRDEDHRTRTLIDAVTAAVERDLLVSQGRLTARLDFMESSLRTVGTDLETAAGTLMARGDAVGDAVAALQENRKEHTDLVRQLQHETISEIDAMLQLHRRLPLDGASPLMWGWALSPRALLQVVDLALAPNCSTVLECGSGTSTIYLGRSLRDRPGARVLSLEHLPEVARGVREHVRAHGLQDVVEVRCTPLVDLEVDGEVHRWYDLSDMNDIMDIDLLLVDGPPGSSGPMARYPAFPELRELLSKGAIVALDDVNRREEGAIMERWQGLDDRLERVWSISPSLGVLRWNAK